MIKRYCDCCGDEVTDKNRVNSTENMGGVPGRLSGKLRKPGGNAMLKFEVITGKNSTWNDGDFCKNCIIDAVRCHDDRTRQA